VEIKRQRSSPARAERDNGPAKPSFYLSIAQKGDDSGSYAVLPKGRLTEFKPLRRTIGIILVAASGGLCKLHHSLHRFRRLIE
jgi:hypothetical protein